MTDLAREIEELLCDCDRRNGDHGDHWASCYWVVRGPVILAFITRQLDEARADSELSQTALTEIASTNMFGMPNGEPLIQIAREALRKLVGGAA